MTILLKNWSTSSCPADTWRAPEACGNPSLAGKVYNHPKGKFLDGDSIITSRIKSARGRLIEVESGRKYLLDGPPDPKWVEFMASIGRTVDLERPIKFQEDHDWNRNDTESP